LPLEVGAQESDEEGPKSLKLPLLWRYLQKAQI